MKHDQLIAEYREIEADALRSLSGQSMYLDGPNSPGAEFLKDVRDAAIEVIEQGEHADRQFELSVSLDNIVTTFGTHEAWKTWLDLTGYTVDISDYGDPEGRATIEQMRDWALISIGEALGGHLFNDYSNRIDEDEDDDA